MHYLISFGSSILLDTLFD